VLITLPSQQTTIARLSQTVSFWGSKNAPEIAAKEGAGKSRFSSSLVTPYRFPGSSKAFKNLDWSSGSFRSKIPQMNLPFQKRSTSPW
jgi:hypothetical protein